MILCTFAIFVSFGLLRHRRNVFIYGFPVFLLFSHTSTLRRGTSTLKAAQSITSQSKSTCIHIMRETRSHVKAAKRYLRSLQKEPVRVINLDTKKTNKKTSLAKPKKEANTTENKCNSCYEAADNLFSLPCNHLFCKDCVRGLFIAALDDHLFCP